MKRLFTIIYLMLFMLPPIAAQSVSKFGIDSGGASVFVEGIRTLYTIGEMAVKENSTEGLRVSEGFVNPNPKAGLSISNNGFSNLSLLVYPNPAKKHINVAANIVFTKIELIDVLGRIIFQSSSASVPIGVSTFKAGIYLLRLYKNTNTVTRRIVIE